MVIIMLYNTSIFLMHSFMGSTVFEIEYVWLSWTPRYESSFDHANERLGGGIFFFTKTVPG